MVRLGESEWSRHTYARPKDDDLRLLGSVQNGMQIGALAISPDGEYRQVVGDHVTTLNKAKIDAAVKKAATFRGFVSHRAKTQPVTTPSIVIKRRRIPVMD